MNKSKSSFVISDPIRGDSTAAKVSSQLMHKINDYSLYSNEEDSID